MRAEIQSGELTKDSLNELTEQQMEDRFDASRDTVRKARNDILKECNVVRDDKSTTN
jgi:DNA-binding GntR family transcriptional regulator